MLSSLVGSEEQKREHLCYVGAIVWWEQLLVGGLISFPGVGFSRDDGIHSCSMGFRTLQEWVCELVNPSLKRPLICEARIYLVFSTPPLVAPHLKGKQVICL